MLWEREQSCSCYEKDSLCDGVSIRAPVKPSTDNGLCIMVFNPCQLKMDHCLASLVYMRRREKMARYSIPYFFSSSDVMVGALPELSRDRTSVWVLVLMFHSGPTPGPQPGDFLASNALVHSFVYGHFCPALWLASAVFVVPYANPSS